ncbi:UDP-2,3-diacylglucosamine hydrolase [Gammaproteobacteria bacterium]
MAILFISDLHLRAAYPATTINFLAFLAGPARIAEELYILGDLFDLWIGDDAPQPEDQPVLTALRTLSDSGIPVSIMPGNHDFLYGSRFAEYVGCRLLSDPCVIDLHGTRTLLMHGDSLCTNDVSYQHFRTMVRNPVWQAEQLIMPAEARLLLAKDLQMRSRVQTMGKNKEMMDVNQSAVESALRVHAAYCLIHGHTHRPADYRFALNGQEARRIVLPNWRADDDVRNNGKTQGGYLECTKKECRILDLTCQDYNLGTLESAYYA